MLSAAVVFMALLPDAGCPGDVIGREEQVAIGEVVLRAKVDTGADRTTIHAERIELRAGEVAFQIVEPDAPHRRASVRSRVVRFVTVKSSNGERERRPVVAIDLCLGTHRRVVEASLTSREAMRLPVLLGRDVLTHGYLVDAARQDVAGAPSCR